VTTAQPVRRSPLFVLATVALLVGLVFVVLDLRGPPRFLWALPLGLACLFSGIARGKRIEVALGAMATVVGLVTPFL